jgi:hypothetical protein
MEANKKVNNSNSNYNKQLEEQKKQTSHKHQMEFKVAKNGDEYGQCKKCGAVEILW